MAFGSCIILFNPIIKLVIHKKEWQVIDLVVAIGLLAWCAYDLFKQI